MQNSKQPMMSIRKAFAASTGKFIGAKFEYDTTRPVDGYAALQLYTHAVIFNATGVDGSTCALQLGF
jgi:hypothetical protein